MNYVIFDLEWNQGSDGKKGKQHEIIPFEIIEIGAVKFDFNMKITGQFSQVIKPSVYKNIHYITANMVHIKKDELKKGKNFEEVINQFLEWCGDDYIFCTWGNLDLVELQRNMKYYNLPLLSDGPIPYLDVQKLFSIEFEDGKIRRTLENAVDQLNIEKDISFHRAYSDAYYTAKILEKISAGTMEYCSYDICSLPLSKKQEVYVKFPEYSKYISREFRDKNQAIADREVLSTKCYVCNRPAKRIIKWFTPNGKHYYSVSLCTQHGYLKGKIRIRKSVFHDENSESVYVIKTLKLISKEQMEEIRQRQRNARKARQIKRKKSVEKEKKDS